MSTFVDEDSSLDDGDTDQEELFHFYNNGGIYCLIVFDWCHLVIERQNRISAHETIYGIAHWSHYSSNIDIMSLSSSIFTCGANI